MSGTPNRDLESYLHAWTDMMIDIWQEKLTMLKVNDTWELYRSFESTVMIQSGGDQSKIDFAFRQYGFYVNAGVGKETYRGNQGDTKTRTELDTKTNTRNIIRKINKKPWFDKGWFRSIYALRRRVAKIYGEETAKSIVFNLDNI